MSRTTLIRLLRLEADTIQSLLESDQLDGPEWHELLSVLDEIYLKLEERTAEAVIHSHSRQPTRATFKVAA